MSILPRGLLETNRSRKIMNQFYERKEAIGYCDWDMTAWIEIVDFKSDCVDRVVDFVCTHCGIEYSLKHSRFCKYCIQQTVPDCKALPVSPFVAAKY